MMDWATQLHLPYHRLAVDGVSEVIWEGVILIDTWAGGQAVRGGPQGEGV